MTRNGTEAMLQLPPNKSETGKGIPKLFVAGLEMSS